MSHPTDETDPTRVRPDLRLDDTGPVTETQVAVLRRMTEHLSDDEARAFSDLMPPQLRRRIVARPAGGGGQHAVAPGD